MSGLLATALAGAIQMEQLLTGVMNHVIETLCGGDPSAAAWSLTAGDCPGHAF